MMIHVLIVVLHIVVVIVYILYMVSVSLIHMHRYYCMIVYVHRYIRTVYDDTCTDSGIAHSTSDSIHVLYMMSCSVCTDRDSDSYMLYVLVIMPLQYHTYTIVVGEGIC